MGRRGLLGRCIGLGATAGLAALVLWPLSGHPWLVWPLALLAALAGLCGAAILAVTATDLRYHRPRGDRIRAVRTFDVLLGGALVVLAFFELRDVYAWIVP